MADALKEMFNKKFYEQFAQEFNKVDKNFHPEKFVKDVTKNIEQYSLNERMRNTSIVLKNYLPSDYKKSIELLFKVIPNIKRDYTSLIFSDFVGLYGHNDFNNSMEALNYFTQFGSSEFAIREFLKRDFNKTIKVMNAWAENENHHVRRLASEGCRPRLPWSFKLDEVIKNPKVTLSILEKLNADEELYVRKSVANHLNDISKDNTDWMLQILNGWDKTNANTYWIIKHASRTLIKKGNIQSLSLFDFEKNAKVNVANFKLNKSKLKLGEILQFDFDVISEKSKSQKLVIDFAVHYVKKSGERSAKVFKLKESDLKPKQTISISKKHRFQDFSTRKHYSGKHIIEILINGISVHKKQFELDV
ncbi:MAG: DNA alkylation repair protein [Bacteroidota bacterium]|nr:DNA alkylation repair protein [Bacteroidota bacterium]